jgi:hypothetical protein
LLVGWGPGSGRYDEPVSPRRPDLFIVGAPKSGTTSLYEYLRGHPQVFMCAPKEPRYFCPDVQRGVARDGLRYGRDLERYLALFAGATREKRLGEATTRYLYSAEAARLVHGFQPDAFIIASLRNPIDMMLSLHGHHYRKGAENIASFEAALAAEDDRRKGERVPRSSDGSLLLYRDWARFGQQLTRWFELFGADRLHIIIFEELIQEPGSVYRRLLEFLGVDPEYRPDSFSVHNPASRRRGAVARTLLNSTKRSREMLSDFLPDSVRDATISRIGRALRRDRRQPVERVPLDPRVRAQLQAELAADVATASRLVGRDLAALWFHPQADQRHDVAAAPLVSS